MVHIVMSVQSPGSKNKWLALSKDFKVLQKPTEISNEQETAAVGATWFVKVSAGFNRPVDYQWPSSGVLWG